MKNKFSFSFTLIKIKIISITLIILTESSCCAYIKKNPSKKARIQTTSEDYKFIKNKKYSQELTINALRYSKEFKIKQKKDLLSIVNILEPKWKKMNQKEKLKMKEKIKKRLKNELQYIKEFDSKVSNFKIYDNQIFNPKASNQISFPLKYNKISLFLEYSINNFDKDFDSIISGKKIEKTLKSISFPARDDKSEDLANYTIPSIISTLFASMKEILPEKTFNKIINEYSKTSPLFYWYQNPKEIKINKNSMLYLKYNNFDGIAVIHNGYAFGDSFGTLNFDNRQFSSMPHDCSLFASHLIKQNSKYRYLKNINYYSSTDNFLNLYNFLNEIDYFEIADIRQNINKYGMLNFSIEIVPLKNIKISELKEGDMIVYRSFKNKRSLKNTLGNGGHAFVILSTDRINKVFGISYLRNYETSSTGGFLASTFSYDGMSNEPTRKGFLIRLKNNVSKRNKIKIWQKK